jgi:hypothetical protein
MILGLRGNRARRVAPPVEKETDIVRERLSEYTTGQSHQKTQSERDLFGSLFSTRRRWTDALFPGTTDKGYDGDVTVGDSLRNLVVPIALGKRYSLGSRVCV